MLFNSLEFAVFFPVVTAGYFLLPRQHRWILLLVASYAFYMAWKPEYALLLFASTVLDWFVALRMPGAATPGRRRGWLAVSVVGNFGTLFAFKYWNLANGTAAWLFPSWPVPLHDWILPVGISFYVFQTVSYAIDVYRGAIQPERSLARFALYVSFFPQLVAGPIERATRLLPQLQRPTSWDWDRTASGLRLAAWGMFKKVVVADRVALVVNAVYGEPEAYRGFAFVVAALFFSYQVYCDFSGYSDIAVGVARVLGFELMPNFESPYTARSFTDLVSRWHTSLTTWFRDYVYIPLGGNRVPFARWAFNVTFVFFLSGFWHGAGWHFALWGTACGLALVVDRVTRPARDLVLARTGALRAPLEAALAFGVWSFLLIAFRAERDADLLVLFPGLLTGWSRVGQLEAFLFFLERVHLDAWRFAVCVAGCALVHAVDGLRWSPRGAAWWASLPTPGRWALDYTLVFATMLMGVWSDAPFVYFQF